MSYEEKYREPYRAECACGKGFLRYYKITLENDWFQTQESSTKVEIHCDECAEKYHYESGYLVPNGLSFPKEHPHLDYKYRFDFVEEIVAKYGKEGIEAILADMTAPKHTYIKNLTTEIAFSFANDWYSSYRQKSLKPMVDYLQRVLKEFDSIKASYDKKKEKQDEYHEAYEAYYAEKQRVEEQSFNVTFRYDQEKDEADREEARRKREEYEETHKYDPFTANVKYDASFSRDWTNQYWDTYLITECTDPQYLILFKPIVGTPEITIAKKYKCVCQLCGKETEVISSDFKIGFDSEIGYYPEPCCDCHSVSSFEAKVMEILNELGITYMREKTFDSLLGDSGRPLRFDFALYRNKKDSGEPEIDLLIELQGPHHYKVGYYDEYGEFIADNEDIGNRLEKQLRYDEKKKEFCLNKGINLECIKYTVSGDYDRLEQKLIEILKKYGYKYFKEQMLDKIE